MSKHFVTVTTEYEVDVRDESILTDCLRPEWQKGFYRFHDRADVLGWLALNLGKREWKITQIDGLADRVEGAVLVHEIGEWTNVND